MSAAAGDWRDRARELRAADPHRTYASLAAEFGVSLSAVWRAVHPERAREHDHRRSDSKRTWAREHDRGVCEVCGGPTSRGGHDGRAVRRCWQHEVEARRAPRMAKAAVLERMWADGASLREIADALGTTVGTVEAEMVRLRREGLADLPYRYRRLAAQ